VVFRRSSIATSTTSARSRRRHRLDGGDLAVFVSPNAVDRAMNAIRSRRAWPAGLRRRRWKRERARRSRAAVTEVIAPSGRFDSEALLAMPALARRGEQRVVIFRGDGGRELLGDTLRLRGATVDYVACYRRVRPAADAGPLVRALGRGEIDAVVASSSEGLRNLFEMVGEAGRQRLQRTPLFAPHARIAEGARALGCEQVVETAPGDTGLAAALAAFWARM
jgi:uroporphyrinogen-III synthase